MDKNKDARSEKKIVPRCVHPFASFTFYIYSLRYVLCPLLSDLDSL